MIEWKFGFLIFREVGVFLGEVAEQVFGVGAHLVIAMSGECLEEEFTGLPHLATCQTFLIHLAVFFSKFEKALGQGEAGFHGHLVAGVAFTEWFNDAIGSFVHRNG